ncbi:MAG TPA: DUF1778 domain-containing protein [Candidatus Obscuribacterales bacterium]
MATAEMRKLPAEKRKNHRFDLRATAEQKSAIEQAALLKQTSATNFILDTAYEAAQRVIREQANIVLSTSDWQAFCDALDNPPEPSPALRKLITRRSRLNREKL